MCVKEARRARANNGGKPVRRSPNERPTRAIEQQLADNFRLDVLCLPLISNAGSWISLGLTWVDKQNVDHGGKFTPSSRVRRRR